MQHTPLTETVSLKEHFYELRKADQLAVANALAAQEKATSAALAAAEKAVAVAERNAEKWRENANEWRAAMTDKDKLQLPRSEFEVYKTSTEKALNVQQGKGMGRMELWGLFAVGVGVVGGIITIFIRLL